MTLRPLGDRVLIKPDEAPTMTDSGLHLAEHWKPEQVGTIVAVGHQMKRTPSVKADDRVLFSWSAGQEVFLHDTNERYLLMHEDDVIAVLEE